MVVMEHGPLTPERQRPNLEVLRDDERSPEVEPTETAPDNTAERLREAEARLAEELKHEQDPLERARQSELEGTVKTGATEPTDPIDDGAADKLLAEAETTTTGPRLAGHIPANVPMVRTRKQLRILFTVLAVVVVLIVILLLLQI